MVKISFEPYEEMTSEDWDRIFEFISQFGENIDIREDEK